MAYGEISGAEPSTVTFKLASVTQEWNSTVRHQEIVTLGGTLSTLAQAEVLDSAPASTVWALAVRQVGHSTTVNVSSLGGAVIVRSSAANLLASVYQSSAADLNVTVAGYVAPSTIVTVSTGSVRVHQSTAGDLQATVTPASTTWAVQMSQYSTTAQVSSVGGIVAITPVSTASVRVHQSTGTDHKVSESAGSAFTYGQVAMNSSAVQIVAANTARKRLVIVQHSSAVNVFLGASTVTAATGLLLAGIQGNQVVFRSDDAVYGITSASTATVSFVEETH